MANKLNVAISDVQHTLLSLRGVGEAQLTWKVFTSSECPKIATSDESVSSKDYSFAMEVLRHPDNIDELSREVSQFCR